MDPARIEGILIDVAGVLHVGDEPIPGSAAAIERLRAVGLPLRFVTNTTRRTRASLVERLVGLGFEIEAREVFTAPLAARREIESRGLDPHLLVHPDLLPEFAGMRTGSRPAVVVGDAGDEFTYARLDDAFRRLVGGAELVALGTNRYFRQGDRLSLDLGPFVRALEYAAGVEATVVGKPAPAFFASALADLGVPASAAAMIGDDVEHDAGAAKACGLTGVLVRTGKYRPGDEDGPARPDAVVDDLAAAVEWILGSGSP